MTTQRIILQGTDTETGGVIKLLGSTGAELGGRRALLLGGKRL